MMGYQACQSQTWPERIGIRLSWSADWKFQADAEIKIYEFYCDDNKNIRIFIFSKINDIYMLAKLNLIIITIVS